MIPTVRSLIIRRTYLSTNKGAYHGMPPSAWAGTGGRKKEARGSSQPRCSSSDSLCQLDMLLLITTGPCATHALPKRGYVSQKIPLARA
eukprot:2996675-Pyramimonas_sp.AAC.1